MGDGSAFSWPQHHLAQLSSLCIRGCAVPVPGSCRESQGRFPFLLMSQVRCCTEHSQKGTQHHSPGNLPKAQFPPQPEEPRLMSLYISGCPGLWSALWGLCSACPAGAAPLSLQPVRAACASRGASRAGAGGWGCCSLLLPNP